MKLKKIVSVIMSMTLVFTFNLGPQSVSASEEGSLDLQVSGNNSENTCSLNWTSPNKDKNYSYKVYAKEDSEADFKCIPAKNTVKVLNIYPGTGNNLKSNMESSGYGRGLISVDAITISDFNANPYGYLKDANGNWMYDAVYEGAADSNNGNDVNSAATEALSQFINTGRGFLTAHDSLTPTMAGYMDILQNGASFYGCSSIRLNKRGSLINYPWKIGSVGEIFSVPKSHTTGQCAYTGDIWFGYNGSSYSGETAVTSNGKQYSSNFYLTTNNNTGMIQAGHSTGSITDAEEKILANTLLYLPQVTEDDNCKDHQGDITAPARPSVINIMNDNSVNKVNINFTGEDKASNYKYYVEAIDKETGRKIDSEVKSTSVKSGIKGYSIVVDDKIDTKPSSNITTTSTSYTFDTPSYADYYVHVSAVDNAGNVSKPATYKCSASRVLNLGTGNVTIDKGDTAEMDLYLTNLDEIQSENCNVTYDSSKLEYTGFASVDGVRLIMLRPTAGNISIATKNNEKSKAPLKTHLVKLYFKGKAEGTTSVNITNGVVSNKDKTMIKTLKPAECGNTLINVSDK